MKKFLILLLILIPTFVLADTGPKPTINITLKNMKDSNYLIDLVSDFSNKQDLIDNIVDRYEEYKDHEIYKYHDGSWYATAIRNRLLFGSIEGNDNFTHTFTYFGVPNEFRVIIELSDGTIKTTERIKKTSFDFSIEIDVNDMKVVEKVFANNNYLKNVLILVLTIVIEVLIALLFKTKKYHIIALVNLITNICLQLMIIYVLDSSLIYFILLEFVILIVEMFIYLKTLKIEKPKTIIYAAIANIVTALLTFII